MQISLVLLLLLWCPYMLKLLLLAPFLYSIHFSINSAWWTFQGTIYWWSGVPTIPCGRDFCGFEWHTPMVPSECNWNCVVRWGTYMLIFLASCLLDVVGLLAYIFVGWYCPIGLAGTRTPLHIKRIWSVLWISIFLYQISLCGEFLMLLINIVPHSLLLFLCRNLIIHYWWYVCLDWFHFTSVCSIISGLCLSLPFIFYFSLYLLKLNCYLLHT